MLKGNQWKNLYYNTLQNDNKYLKQSNKNRSFNSPSANLRFIL